MNPSWTPNPTMYSFNEPSSLESQLSLILGELSHKANNTASSVQALPLHLLAPAGAPSSVSTSFPLHHGLLPTHSTSSLFSQSHMLTDSSNGHSLELGPPSSSAAAAEHSLKELALAAVARREQDAAAFEKNRMLQEYISLTMAINAMREEGAINSSSSHQPSTTQTQADQDQTTSASERSQIALNPECKTPEQVFYILNILGSTLRSKADPYIDASVYRDPGTQRAVRGGICELFPDKLYRMLCELEAEGRSDIVSFLPHGRAFLVHKMDEFLKDILPRYFSEQSKWSSFSRQLNLYGFLRVSSGPDASAYYHELFLKGHSNLCHYMRRVGAPKGLDRRRYKLPEGKDPNLYAIPLKGESSSNRRMPEPPTSS